MNNFLNELSNNKSNIINDNFKKLLEIPTILNLFNAIPDIFMILNQNRELIFANKSLLEFANKDNLIDVIGLLPGNIFRCKHASSSKNACGSTKYCSFCGTSIAFIQSLNGQASKKECRITLEENNEAMDFRVWSTPLMIDNETFIIFSIQDISNEKRREALEKIFFHDIINTVSGLRGFTEILRLYPQKIDELKDTIFHLTNKLIEEIDAQKQLTAAEQNILATIPKEINSINFIQEIVVFYRNHIVANGKEIIIDSSSTDINFMVDSVLLRRVVGNMLKNALEASNISDTVKIGCYYENNTISFYVNNRTFIPEEIQLQIFQRSFSTKGKGRGLGTYSMKLLTEKYLKGIVDFNSNEKEGTTFKVILPLL